MQPLEQGIRSLVEQFIESGRPCPSLLDIEQRRQGYVASCVLAGEGPEMAEVLVDDLDGILVKVFKPTLQAPLPITVYFHGGCFISGGFDTHDQQLKQIAKLSGSGKEGQWRHMTDLTKGVGAFPGLALCEADKGRHQRQGLSGSEEWKGSWCL